MSKALDSISIEQATRLECVGLLLDIGMDPDEVITIADQLSDFILTGTKPKAAQAPGLTVIPMPAKPAVPRHVQD